MGNEVVYLSAFAGKMKDALICYSLYFLAQPLATGTGRLLLTILQSCHTVQFLQHLIKVPQLNY